MPDHRVTLIAANATEAGSLLTWLHRQGHSATATPRPETLGAGELVSASVAGVAALRALVTVAREWIRAHRTSITVEIHGRGRVVVEGTTDIDDVLELLADPVPGDNAR